MSGEEMTERPRLLFIQPSGWVPPIFELVNGRKKKVREGYRDLERAQEHKAEWHKAFFDAGWDAEPYTDQEDVVALATKRAYRLVILPSYFWAERTAKKLRELQPKPTLLVAAYDWDDDVAATIAYTGADGWFPYGARNDVASAARIWLKGGPTPEEQAILDGMLPLQKLPKKRAPRAKKSAAPKE